MSDRPRKADELKEVAFRFTRFLIDTLAITPEKRRMTKNKLLEYFSTFQAMVPSYMKPAEIINALNQSKLLAKRRVDLSSEIIEFKTIVFVTINNGPSIDIEKLQKPRVRIFINENKVFQNNTRKGSAVCGRECLVCNIKFEDEDDLEDHLKSDIHIFRELYRTTRKRFDVEVNGLLINKVACTLEKDEPNNSSVRITNISTTTVFRIIKDVPLYDLEGITVIKPTTMTIAVGETFEYKLSACFSRYGTYEYPVVFIIEDILNQSRHNLLSVISYKVLKEELHDLCPTAPYVREFKKWVVFKDAPVVSGVPLQTYARLSYRVPLSTYFIPTHLLKFLKNGFKSNVHFNENDNRLLAETKKLLLPDLEDTKPLHNKCLWTPSNYVDRFRTLLHLEEYQQNISMLSYNKDDSTLKKGEGGKWLLDVPGLNEGRPSVLRGDSVFVWPADRRRKFEGVVHDVHENSVSLAFHRTFNYVANEKVAIEFELNRLTFRIAHRALETISKERLVDFLFPTHSNDASRTHVVTRCFNRQIEENHLQKLAVNNIVRNTAYPAPYIIYGPPGTGKTSTIVEAIMQLARTSKKPLKICACAPSNAAANLLAIKIIKHVPESQVLRIFSSSYNAREVPQELRKCSNFTNERSLILFPSIKEIESKMIVIVTPITGGRLYGVLGESLFDYLFLDEAGQAEEPLALIPIMGLLKQEPGKVLGNVVLAGDPKQLGPIIHSRMAAALGFDISLIERLMIQCKPYQKSNGVYNANFITKLTYNYRSHANLLFVPNQLFYDDELECHADPDITNWLCSWDRLPTKNIPLIFHGVKGKDDQEADSPSYFNLDEINCIGDYLNDLLGTRIKGRVVEQKHIVILTPYNKQVKKFRAYFKKKKWENIQVSSIEKFQGQENFVVIVSCVRSRREFLPSDYQFGLGFLRNPKRFNVAITRAKSLMIIVGNPNVLQCDPHWKMLLNHCRDMKCYNGELPDGNTDVDPNITLALDLSALSVTDIPDSEKPSFPKDD